MKVLVLSHMYPSVFNEMNGIFVHEQVKALAAKGVEVQVVSPIPWAPFPFKYLSSKWKAYEAIPDKSIQEGIEVWHPRYITFPRAWLFASSGKRMYYGIRNLVTKIYQEFQFDLIHAHVALPDGYTGMNIAQEYKKPFIVTIHGQDLYITINRNKNCKLALKKVFKSANKIITVSSKLKKIAVNNIGYNDKTMIIGNGISSNKIITKKNNIFHKSNANDINILSVSYLIKRKGIDFNLKAFAKLISKYPNLKYQIIGDGPEKNCLKKLATNLGIDERVEFLGRLAHKEVLKYMAKADIFSLPSWNEGFGVVYIEAMAQGKPVIGCRGEGIEDFVEDGKTGMLVKPKDVDSLVEVLDFLLDCPNKARDIGERARKFIKENYTWEKNAEKTMKVYREVIKNAC
jgi:glycosyltransferase involved in cell wall biosynthesis